MKYNAKMKVESVTLELEHDEPSTLVNICEAARIYLNANKHKQGGGSGVFPEGIVQRMNEFRREIINMWERAEHHHDEIGSFGRSRYEQPAVGWTERDVNGVLRRKTRTADGQHLEEEIGETG